MFSLLLRFRLEISQPRSRGLRTNDGNWRKDMQKRWKGRDRYKMSRRCSRTPPDREKVAGGGAWRTSRDRGRARKCALASLCIFQETRVRRAAVKWHETDRIPGSRAADSSAVSRAIACSFRASLVPSRNTDNPIHRRRRRERGPRTLFRRFYTPDRFITFAIFRRGGRPKVANAGIIRRKPQLRRFERLTAMRAISDRGWLFAGRFERWTPRENTRDSPRSSPKIARDSLITEIQILDCSLPVALKYL